MMLYRPTLFVCALAFVVAGCGSSDEPTARLDDDQIRRLELSISGEIPLPSELGNLTDFDIAPDGTVAVLDGYAPTVWVISPGGQMVNFGREGGGPGELKQPKDVEISDNAVVVYDQANGTVVWSRAGDVRRTEPASGVVTLELWGDSLLTWRSIFTGPGTAADARYALRALDEIGQGAAWIGPVSVRAEPDTIGPCHGCDIVFSSERRVVHHVRYGDGRILVHPLGTESAELWPATGRSNPEWMLQEWSEFAAAAWNQTSSARTTGRSMSPRDVPPPSEGSQAPLTYDGESAGMDRLGRVYVLARMEPGANSVIDVWQDRERTAELAVPFRARLMTVQRGTLYAVEYDDLGVPRLLTLPIPSEL